MTRHEQAARHIPIDFIACHAGLKLETILKKVRSMENRDTARARKSGNGLAPIVGLLPTERTEKEFPGVVAAWFRQQQPAPPREEQASTADLVELGDALPELVERCARLRAVAGRDKRPARMALAQEWDRSEATIRRLIKAALKGPAALKRRDRADKGRVRGPADLIPQYGKDKIREWLVLIDADLRVQLMDGRKLSLNRRLKDTRQKCLKLNVDPRVLNYARVKKINASIGKGTLAFHGPQKQLYKDGFQPHVLVAKPERPHEVWTIDHFRFDNFWLNPTKRNLRGKVVGGPDRAWLTGVRDECTNYIVGFHISWQGNSQSILLALSDALSRFSPPSKIKHDLGKDFLGVRYTAFCQECDIQRIEVEGRHGQGKGIERYFGVTASDHCPQFRDWCGNSSASKPDRINVTRTMEDGISDYREWLSEYHRTPSAALGGESPNKRLKDHYDTGFKETPLEKRTLRILLMMSKPRTVRQFGIQMWRINGESIIFQAPELYRIIGKKVEACWDPACIGEVYIYERDGNRLKFICSAHHAPLMRIGATSEDLKIAVYEPRRAAKAFHQGVKADAESTYKSLLERIGDAVCERLDLPEPEGLLLAVNQGIPRINRWSHMAREIEEAKRNSPAPVQADPERVLAELAQQRRSQEMAEVDRQYEKAQRKLTLLD